jgi:hypothetical protein
MEETYDRRRLLLRARRERPRKRCAAAECDEKLAPFHRTPSGFVTTVAQAPIAVDLRFRAGIPEIEGARREDYLTQHLR